MQPRSAQLLIFTLLLLGGALLLPDVSLAAEEGSKWGILLPIGQFFNVALVVGVLILVARKPLATFYSTRSQTIREQLAESQAAWREAENKLAEMQSRMSRLGDELKEIKDQAEREAQEERMRLAAEAERDAKKIIERAREAMDGMMRAARSELRDHVAELSVQMAEEKIRQEITDEDHNRLFAGFVTKLGGER